MGNNNCQNTKSKAILNYKNDVTPCLTRNFIVQTKHNNNDDKILNQVQDDNKVAIPRGGKRNGFTLIELLVVVLIIGILAAVAVPQYHKAVWKSRNTQLKTLIKSVADAEQRYFMANGEYAKTFTELDLDLPLSAGGDTCDVGYKEDDSLRGNSSFVIVLSNGYGDAPVASIAGVWRMGKYGCAGFMYHLATERWDCFELPLYTSQEGEFCKQIEKGTLSFAESHRRFYNLP